MNEISLHGESLQTLRLMVENAAGLFWNFGTAVFETKSAPVADYLSPALTETVYLADSRYTASFPPTIVTAGIYHVTIVDGDGVSLLGGDLHWDGAKEIAPVTLDQLTAALSGGHITVVITSPLAPDGRMYLVRGDSYYNADGRAIQFSISGGPDLAAASVSLSLVRSRFNASAGTATLSIAGSIPTPSGGTKVVVVEMSSLQSASLAHGPYDYALVATLVNGHVVTLQKGSVAVS